MVAVQYGDADAADYDNDGKVDLFITGSDVNYFGVGKLYHNGPVNAVENVLNDYFNVYPNPAYNVIHINNKLQAEYKINITDLTGKNVYRNETSQDLQINVSDLSSGIYLVKITSGDKSLVKKMIVK